MIPTSFLYQISAFSDINTMIAMGRAVAHGVVPFVDIFEQRGPYMYLIHTVAVLPGNSIHWIYILELIIFYWLYRILILIVELNPLTNHKQSRFYSAIIISILLFSPSLDYGATPEEFCFVPAFYTLYVILKNANIAKTKNQEIHIPKHEIFLIGLGLGWTVMIKFATIGTISGFFITYGLYLIFKKQIKEFITTVLYAIFGTTVSLLPVIIYYSSINELQTFIYQYFNANSGLSAYSLQSAIPKFIRILGADLITNSGYLILISIFIIYAIIKTKSFKQQNLATILFSTFAIQLGMSLLIMRFAPAYTSLSILFIVGLSAWAAPDVIKDIQKTPKLQKIILLSIFAPILIAEIIFVNGAFLRLDKTVIHNGFQPFSLKNDASYIQGNIIKNHGGGNIESYANVPWGIYDYADNYPKLKYFDQTTIPYKSQMIAGDSQYKYIKNKNATWVQTPIVKISFSEQKTANEFIEKYTKENKLVTESATESLSPKIDAPLMRSRKYPKEYYTSIQANMKNTAYILPIPPKVLYENYNLINVHEMSQASEIIYFKHTKIKITTAYALLTTKENSKRHNLKPIPMIPHE